MTSLARVLVAISNALARLALTISCAALVLMLACMLVQVVARYVLSQPLAWTEELARYAMIWSGFLGATTAFQRNADPVLLRRSSLPTRLRPLAAWLALIAPTIFAIAVLMAAPGVLALAATRETEALQAPNIIIVSILPVSFALLLVHVAAKAAQLLTGQQDAP